MFTLSKHDRLMNRQSMSDTSVTIVRMFSKDQASQRLVLLLARSYSALSDRCTFSDTSRAVMYINVYKYICTNILVCGKSGVHQHGLT